VPPRPQVGSGPTSIGYLKVSVTATHLSEGRGVEGMSQMTGTTEVDQDLEGGWWWWWWQSLGFGGLVAGRLVVGRPVVAKLVVGRLGGWRACGCTATAAWH